MMTINPKELTPPQVQAYLQGAVSPRPIALSSTVDNNGIVNLSPFSFFNVFSANPPILVFSPSRRVRDNTTKHTLDNVLEVPEVVINIVCYEMVQQTSLASTEYERGVNEFSKAGFTELKSTLVKPPRVKESPVSFECKVNQVIPLGNAGGAGNLVICEVLLIHIDERVLDDKGTIDPDKIDTVARMGGDWYCRASGSAIFKVPKPLTTLGIGVDSIPDPIKSRGLLSGNELGLLGNVEQLPSQDQIKGADLEPGTRAIIEKGEVAVMQAAKGLLASGDTNSAWLLLLSWLGQSKR